ncbi:hypothetical protein [Celerinatantimonas sp. YJH-8]
MPKSCFRGASGVSVAVRPCSPTGKSKSALPKLGTDMHKKTNVKK